MLSQRQRPYNALMASSDQSTPWETYQKAINAHAAGDWHSALWAYHSLDANGINSSAFEFAFALALQQAPVSDGGDISAALARYDRVVAIEPSHAHAWLNRGACFVSLGQSTAALESYSRAIEADNQLALAYFNRGVLHHGLGQFDQAIKDYECALNLEPQQSTWIFNLAEAWRAKGLLTRALALYDQALAIDPRYEGAWCNRGVVLRSLGRFEESVESLSQAIAVNPGYAEAYSNRGLAFRDSQALDQAIHSFSKAIAIRPDYSNAHLNQAFTRLLLGDYKEGFRQYEWRHLSSQSAQSAHPFKSPLWLGEPSLAGKCLLIHAEQGLGDTLQFVRFVRHVANEASKILLFVPDVFHRLFSQLAPNIELVNTIEATEGADFRIPMVSLAFALGCEAHRIPDRAGYLEASQATRSLWQARIEERLSLIHPRPLCVGLVWRGRGQPNPLRNIELHSLLPKLPREHLYVTLQPDLQADEIDQFAPPDACALDPRPRCAHLGAGLADFADTAAICSLMDLVISVDTSLAHLAGALGQSSLVLLPFSPDWRWGLGRSEAPWYASVELLRQGAHGQWDDVLHELPKRMAQMFAKNRRLQNH